MNFWGKIPILAGVLASLCVGWIGFPRVIYSSRPQPVAFSHPVHAQKAGMLCVDCHAPRPDGTYAGVPPLSRCAGCHTTNLGPSAAEKTFIAEYVKPKREPQWAVYARQPENVWFSHTPHIRIAKLQCEECHGDQASSGQPRPYQEDRISGYSRDIWGYEAVGGAVPGMKMDDCIACHRREGLAHSCLDCHK
ncbi:MAG TPA: menaquinone reductase multiheme cytochrome c subunit QrcA [Bryobacteraceae bacterium]|nr:menaquinone reductase multiheme cytochrome c subunit QrcA [Bryobacteraceae bacterium]